MNDLGVPQHRSGQQQGVNAIENAAVTGQQVAGVFDASRALERGLGQVAHLGSRVHHHGYYAPMEDWNLDIRRYVTERIGAYVRD